MKAINITTTFKKFFLLTFFVSLAAVTVSAQTKGGSDPKEADVDTQVGTAPGTTSPGKNTPGSAGTATGHNGQGSDNQYYSPTTDNLTASGQNELLPPLVLREVQDGYGLQVGGYQMRMLSTGSIVVPAIIIEYSKTVESQTFTFYTNRAFSDKGANAFEMTLKDQFKELKSIDINTDQEICTVTFKRNIDDQVLLNFFGKFHFDGYLFYQKQN